MNNDSASLRSLELLPTSDSDRTMSLFDYIMLWAGMTVNIVGFSLGAQYFNEGKGLSPWVLVVVILVGYGIVTMLTAMVGDIGTKYGIPFAVYARAPFGYKGFYIAGFLRAIPALYWFGFLTWVGALSLNYIMDAVIPGFDNLTLMIIVFGALQIVNAMYGLKAMAKFDAVAIPILAILFVAILIAITGKYNVSIPDIMSTPAEGGFPFFFAVSGIAGGWITMALNGSDLSRQIKKVPGTENKSFWIRNQRAILGQFIGLMIVGVLCMLVGMAAGITTGEWELNAICKDLFSNNKFGLILALIAIVFAQWSTNTAANLMPPTYILLGIFHKLNFKIASIISGVVGIGIMPWKIQNSGSFLVSVQVWISTLLGPLIGILLVDYFIIRKTKLNVQDMYTAGGQYQYSGGYNLGAIAALILGFAASFLSSVYGFYLGLIIAPIVYTIIMKVSTLKKYDQKIGEVIEFDPDK